MYLTVLFNPLHCTVTTATPSIDSLHFICDVQSAQKTDPKVNSSTESVKCVKCVKCDGDDEAAPSGSLPNID